MKEGMPLVPSPEYLYRRITKVLKNKEVDIKLANMHDNGDYLKGKARINKSVVIRSRVVIHECIHHIYPRKIEEEVCELVRVVYHYVSKRQLERIIFLSNLIIYEKKSRNKKLSKKR